MPYLKNGEPMCVIWLGNFFEPEYSSQQAVEKALVEIKDMGFNGIELDSKQWQDFQDYFEGGAPSQYVGMQLFAIKEAEKIGLGHMFLSLYLNGDNLYPAKLRESPPVLVNRPVGYDGKEMACYRYWDSAVQQSMTAHVGGLLNHMEQNHLTARHEGEDMLPVVTFFEPWITPSFDKDGRDRYVSWLEARYGSIDKINERYGTSYGSFDDIGLSKYWCGAERFVEVDSIPPSVYGSMVSFEAPGCEFLKFVDNQLWRAHEYGEFFKDMESRLKAIGKNIYIMPILYQWQVFFGSGKCWNSVSRSIDPWVVGRHVHSCSFNTLPSDMFFNPSSYAVSAEISVSRSASVTEDFVAGLDICRFIENDVYAHCPPSEIIATAVLHGAQGMHVYGYNGLDDGGSLKRMPFYFREDVKKGVEFFKAAAKLIKGRKRKKEAAILYPIWMSLFQPMEQERAGEKADFLGWFRYLCDQGYHVDVIHPRQICDGGLDSYDLLVLPYDPYYVFDPCPSMEQSIKEWVAGGATLVHGADCAAVRGILDPGAAQHACDSIVDKYIMLPLAYDFETFETGHAVVRYKDGSPAAVDNALGEGTVLSIGFNPGLAYINPSQWVEVQGNGMRELYQFCMFDESFLSRYLHSKCRPCFEHVKGVEQAVFEDVQIAVNHNAYGIRIRLKDEKEYDLAAHGYGIWRIS